MASRRDQILAALAAALDGAAKPAGFAASRYRILPVTPAELAGGAGSIYPLKEDTSRGDGPMGYKARRRLLARVELRTAVADDSTPDTTLDPLISWAVRAVMADPRFGGLAHNTQELGVQWAADPAEHTIAGASVDFAVDYVTSAADPDLP